jgi:poly(ribitol-phosphate) beta-N-acetylglucosaminyltransferase
MTEMERGVAPAMRGKAFIAAARHQAEPDRPWLRTADESATRKVIPGWRRASAAPWRPNAQHWAHLDQDLGDYGPGISVVMPSFGGRDTIGHSLRSLGQQTLDPTMFEIIVVLNGPPDGTRDVLADFQRDFPAVTLRVVQMTLAGASRAWNAGIAAASRQYTTFVDDDDSVSPAFLEVLLRHAGPRVVSIATIADVTPDGEINYDNYINNGVAPFIGRRTPAADLPVGTSSNSPKAVATKLIKDISYHLHLQSGMDVVFWTTVVVRHGIDFFPCAQKEGAIYYRGLRDNSMSRQGLTYDFNVSQRLAVIAELDRLVDESDGSIQRLVHSRMAAQAGFVARYLQELPEEHSRVAQALDRSTIAHFPYSTINGKQARGLAIAYAFPPYADTSAIVMAKRLRARGEIVDVVQNDMTRIREWDESLQRISGPFVAQRVALETPSYFSDWSSMEKFGVLGLDVIADWQRKKGRYEWVYSRAHFAASHFLAAAYKLANPGARWLAEFSDPLSRDIHDKIRGGVVRRGPFARLLASGMAKAGLPLPSTRNSFVWCEEIAYALADELYFTNKNQCEYMLSYCSNPELAALARAKAVIAPQPTLSEDFYHMLHKDYPLDPHKVHLAYFGNFYATRGLDDVLVAIARHGRHLRSRLRIHVFTTKPTVLAQRAEELGIPDCVVAGPYVRYLEFLNLTTRFDCLIVNDAATAGVHLENPYLPSKWSDYRGSDTATWGLIEAGSPLSHEQLSHVSPVGDVERAAQILEQLVEKKAVEPGPAMPMDATFGRPR